MEILPLEPRHASQVAELHISGIHTGFISSLGPDFVTALYKAIAQSPHSFGYIASENDQILGFIAFTTGLKPLYKSVCLKNGPKFAFLLAGKLLSWKSIKKIIETLFYPDRKDVSNLPDAELLSIVVSDQARGRGVGRRLIRAGLDEAKRKNIGPVKVLVAADNEPANRLYEQYGFIRIKQVQNHGILSNILVSQASDKNASGQSET